MNNKLFHGSLLENILLNLINQHPKQGIHGYAIQQSIRKNFGVLLSSSSIYPALNRLEKLDLINSNWTFDKGRAQKHYLITTKGKALMRQYLVDLQTVIPVLVNSTSKEWLVSS